MVATEKPSRNQAEMGLLRKSTACILVVIIIGVWITCYPRKSIMKNKMVMRNIFRY